jgi:putative tricarboxylic transport membrane protein
MSSADTPNTADRSAAAGQTWVGCGVLVIGVIMAVGASMIPAEAGYSGVGPNMEAASGAQRGDWSGFAWMSAGLLANAALITTIGFILSCTLCFVLAVRGLRNAQADAPHSFDIKQTIKDIFIGAAIAAPVYWMFTKLLAINLPGLTSTGWI